MAKITIDGQPVEVPDDLTDAELEQIVNELTGPPPPSTGQRLLQAGKEAVMAPVAPLAALMGLPGAKETLSGMLSPNVGKTGVPAMLEVAGEKVESAVRPILQGAQTRLAGLPGMIAESKLANVSPELAAGAGTAAHIATMPSRVLTYGLEAQAGGLKASEIANNLGAEAVTAFGPAAAGAIAAGGKSVGTKLLQLGGKSTPEAAQVMAANPEITQAGWFAKNIGKFTEDVLGSVKALKERAKTAAINLKQKFGGRPSAVTEEAARSTAKSLQNIPETVLKSPKDSAAIDQALETINNALEASPTPGPKVVKRSVSGIPLETIDRTRKLKVSEAMALDDKLTQLIDDSMGSISPDTFNWLRQTRDNIRFTLEKTPGATGKWAKEARTLASKQYATDRELMAVIGKKPDLVDFSDSATRSKMLSWLHNSIKAGDKTVLATLESLQPGLAETAKKLAAVSGDQFAFSLKDALPATMSLGAAGYAAKNPGSAGKAALLLGFLATFASPRAAAGYARTAISAGKAAGAVGRAIEQNAAGLAKAAPMLPGFIPRKKK